MLIQGQIPDAITQIYTVGIGQKSRIGTIKLLNVSPATEYVYLYSKTGGNSLRLDGFELEPGVGIEFSPSFPLEYLESDGIEAETTTNNGVNFFILGVESAI